MDRRFFVAALAGIVTTGVLPCQGAEAPSWRSQLLGVWSLIDAFTTSGDQVYPWFGRKTPITGLLMYLDNGWMSVQISGAKPGPISRADFERLPTADRAKWLDEYYAYYGTFEIDEMARVITHRIADSLLPYEKATLYRRRFELQDGVLTLVTDPHDDRGKTVFSRLIWKKIA